VECADEFNDVFNHRIAPDARLKRRTADVRDISPWDCDVAVLVDCLDFYLSPSEQSSIVTSVVHSGSALILGGESAWTADLVTRMSRNGSLAVQAVERGPGAFEPLRQGHAVHCPRPAWAAFLLAEEGSD
jgi:hypothetical protein